jgi:hypothetical protein
MSSAPSEFFPHSEGAELPTGCPDEESVTGPTISGYVDNQITADLYA